MFKNVENPFGTDVFTAPPADLRYPSRSGNGKQKVRRLPAAPSLKDLAVKLVCP